MNLSVRFSNTKHVKHVIARAIACSMLLVLPSCIPNLRQPEPGPDLPAGFNSVRRIRTRPAEVLEATSSENSAQLRIEEFFNDPLLLGLDPPGTGQ